MKSILIALTLCLSTAALADDAKKPAPLPTKMTRAQADALYRCFSELGKLDERAKPLLRERNEILAQLGAKPEDLGKTVGLNLDTLEIQRRPEPAPAAKK